MINFPSFFSEPPSLKPLSLRRYLVHLSLNRLSFGVDGIHFDVSISPAVHNVLERAVSASMIRYSRTEGFFEIDKKERRENEKMVLRQVCTDVLLEGINQAKAASEVQIDFLGQAALAKMFLEEIQSGYRKLMTRLETLIRKQELSRNADQLEWLKMKEKLAEVKQNQRRIVRQTGEDLFQVLAEVQSKNLKNIRESIFPAEHILPDNFFLNPTLHSEDVGDDFLLMDSYVILSQRSDDPDNFNSVKAIVHDLFGKTDLGRGNAPDAVPENPGTAGAEAPPINGHSLDPWLMEIDNIDLMFNFFRTQDQYREAEKRQKPKVILLELKSWMEIQRKLLNMFYRKFRKAGLVDLIVAAYEMESVYRSYCPPLRPLQIREYLVRRGYRKTMIREMKRRKMNPNALEPLKETIGRIKACSGRGRKEHLLSFLKDFHRYQRDRENGRLLRQAMDAINLVTDEKILTLSKKNRLLYEYPLPEERVKEEKPIISHVILKADIRGSMDITQTMVGRGLNPAAYFSLNFFDPISEILGDYGASKVFIEGDAIILSIFESEDTVEGWYSVARACGLAVHILHIVRRYNVKNQQHDLPVLELGIGICYRQSPPSFLFDGDSRIMISRAINLADRLSGCDKTLRRRLGDQERLFNLRVFQHVPDEDLASTADDLSLRYNVNGIELEPDGFAKLSREINLTAVPYPSENGESVTLYTGKVPTVSGSYQRLVIREDTILKVAPDTLDVVGPTSRKYYEVCTHPSIYEFIDTHS